MPAAIVFGPARAYDYYVEWTRTNVPLMGSKMDLRRDSESTTDQKQTVRGRLDSVGPETERSIRYGNQSLPASLTRLLTYSNAGSVSSPEYVNIAALEIATFRKVVWLVVVLLVLALILLWSVGGKTPTGEAVEIATVWVATLLLSPIAWTHHFIAALPALYVLYAACTGREGGRKIGFPIVVLVLAEICFLTVFWREPRMYGSLTLGALLLLGSLARLSLLKEVRGQVFNFRI